MYPANLKNEALDEARTNEQLCYATVNGGAMTGEPARHLRPTRQIYEAVEDFQAKFLLSEMQKKRAIHEVSVSPAPPVCK
ncbi:unnamed protein product [Protopolystoma xenopodis]|uniref:Uncharacterized protein n=1 Tax=Protopolystoma xenopodis TaxID=117903 RepID=A0A3S5CGY6_9PLAT|nr:unnamed protein product [Protopolystoma xenopodis]